MSGVSAGGCRNNLQTFALNPQYLITLVDHDEDDEDDLCTLIVALMQKNHRSKRKMGLDSLTIGFAAYKLEDGQFQTSDEPAATSGFRHQMLNTEFFKYNASVARSPTFVNLREVAARFRLAPGAIITRQIGQTRLSLASFQVNTALFHRLTTPMKKENSSCGSSLSSRRRTRKKTTMNSVWRNLRRRLVYQYVVGKVLHHKDIICEICAVMTISPTLANTAHRQDEEEEAAAPSSHPAITDPGSEPVKHMQPARTSSNQLTDIIRLLTSCWVLLNPDSTQVQVCSSSPCSLTLTFLAHNTLLFHKARSHCYHARHNFHFIKACG